MTQSVALKTKLAPGCRERSGLPCRLWPPSSAVWPKIPCSAEEDGPGRGVNQGQGATPFPGSSQAGVGRGPVEEDRASLQGRISSRLHLAEGETPNRSPALTVSLPSLLWVSTFFIYQGGVNYYRALLNQPSTPTPDWSWALREDASLNESDSRGGPRGWQPFPPGLLHMFVHTHQVLGGSFSFLSCSFVLF